MSRPSEHDAMAKREQDVIAYWIAHPGAEKKFSLTAQHFTQPDMRAMCSLMLAGRYETLDAASEIGLDGVGELLERSRYLTKEGVTRSAELLTENFAVKAAEAHAVAFLKSVKSDASRNKKSIERLARGLHEAVSLYPVKSRPFSEVAHEVTGSWFHAMTNPEELQALPLPWPLLQAHTGGIPKGKIILVGGRSSEHKTTVSRTMAAHLAAQGFRTVFWTLEDSDHDIAARTLASENRVLTTSALANRRSPRGSQNITASELNEAMGQIEKMCKGKVGENLHIADMPNPKLSTVLSQIRSEASKGAVAFFGDFIQLVRPDDARQPVTNTWWRDTIAAFAGLAKELNICIVWTSQVEKTGTKESASEGRVPRGVEIPFGAVMRQGTFGCLMVGLSGQVKKSNPLSGASSSSGKSDKLIIEVDKWKTAANIDSDPTARFIYDIDPAHDRLLNERRAQS